MSRVADVSLQVGLGALGITLVNVYAASELYGGKTEKRALREREWAGRDRKVG
jgi:hypothetical protein